MVMKKLIKQLNPLNLLNITAYSLYYSDISSSIKNLFARWQHL